LKRSAPTFLALFLNLTLFFPFFQLSHFNPNSIYSKHNIIKLLSIISPCQNTLYSFSSKEA
jgi:hypothetical protein